MLLGATTELTRREFLSRAGAGFGTLALAGLLQQQGLLASEPSTTDALAARPGHFPGKARSVIWLFMYGGPSGIDLFDPKPELQRRHGQMPPSRIDSFFGGHEPLMRSPYRFVRRGASGAWVSEVFPHLARCVDDIAFLKGCHAESNNHGPAMLQMNTGMLRVGFPSTGSWVTYGLGSDNRDLPGFVVMYDPRGIPNGGAPYWGAGFLPSAYQGTLFRPTGSPLLNLAPPEGLTRTRQREQLDLLARSNERHRAAHPDEADLAGRIESFELAYRMQIAAPTVIDLSGETAATKALYGADRRPTQTFGTQLLLARRLVERGVRFIQIYSGGAATHWDAHGGFEANHRERCAETDRPIAGLLTDLKQRGLLESTLVVWGGEFGRMPVSQGGNGRDHNPHGFTMWMAGGGIKGGTSRGETDEIGYRAAVDPVSVPDIHATILHLLGLDHRQLTYQHNGRRFRLTDVSGNVLTPILA